MAKKQERGSKGCRKTGRNAASCVRYRNEGRRERNKLRRLERHVKNFPWDNQAWNVLAKMKGLRTRKVA